MFVVKKKNKKTFKSRNITDDILTYNDSNITELNNIISQNETENKCLDRNLKECHLLAPKQGTILTFM